MLWQNMIRCLAIGYKQEQLMVHKQTIPTNSIANINDVKSLLPEDGDSLNESRYSVYSDYLTESYDLLNSSSGSLGYLSYSSDINDNFSKENSQFYIKNSTAIVDLPNNQDFIPPRTSTPEPRNENITEGSLDLPEDGDSLGESSSSVYSDCLTESCVSLNRSSGSLGNLSYSNDTSNSTSTNIK